MQLRVGRRIAWAVLGLCILAPAARAQVPAAYWTFDEGTGTSAADNSGNNRTAALMGSAGWTVPPPASGASLVPVGPYGLSLGSSSYAQASGAAVNTSSNFTACCWVKLNSTAGFQTLLSIDGNNVSGFFLQLQGNGRFGFRKLGSDSTSTTAYYAECPAAASAGVWYHLAGVFSNSVNRLLLYTNGALAANVSYGGTVWSGAGNTAIGRGKYNGGNVDFADGQIDDARLYQSALSSSQIQALYAMGFAPQFALTPMPASLIAPQGGSGTSTITVGKLNGFTGSVTLTASNLPAGVTAVFSPQPAASNSVMTLSVGGSVPVGHYSFAVVGTNNTVVRSIPMLLLVTSNSAVAFKWPAYSPDLNYNFTNEYPAVAPPTNVLNDCANVAGTITLSNNWFCFRYGPNMNSLVTSNAWIPMLKYLDTNFWYFRNVMGWPPDHRAKAGYYSAVYLYGSGLCTDSAATNATGGWMGSIYYNGQDWPMGLLSYYPVYCFDPACTYSDRVSQQGACVHELIHSVLADMPGCKQACWFQEGGNTWLQGEAAARQSGSYSGMGWLSAGSVLAPFMPIECYSGWLQDDSFGGPCAEGVNQGSQYASTWRNMLGGVQYSEAFPHFMGEIVSPGSVAWIWRYCTNRVLEGMATVSGGLGDGQTRRLIMEYRARAAMCDYGKWSPAYTALLDNNWGGVYGPEYQPAWIQCAPWTARCYVVTTNSGGVLTPERRTLPGWSSANQIPLTVAGATGAVASVTFTPLGNNMTCQLVYRASDNSVVYGQPVSGGTCSIRFDKAPKNNVVIAVVCNTDWAYLGEYSRTNKFDYRITLGPGVAGAANVATKWYTTATTTRPSIVAWDGGPGGTGTDLDAAANWSGNVLPSVSTPDTVMWDGSVPGNLSLTHSGTSFAGSSGNAGVDLLVTAAQTGSLAIDSGAQTSAVRVNNITISGGAGALTLGNGANAFNLTLGGNAGQAHTWQNDSTNAATLNSDVAYALGGGGAHTLTVGGGGDWVFNCVINNGTGGSSPALSLTKSGAGKLTLNGTVNPTGVTLFNSGTVFVNGSLTASTFGIASNTTLGGNGTIINGFVLASGATLAPGTGIGKLTVNSSVTLQAGSTTLMEISVLPLTNDQLRVTGALNCGGTLVVTNIGPALQGGERFQLFQAGSITGSFASCTLPALGANRVWNTNSLGSGVLSVVATGPTNLVWGVSGANLTLSWPADHTGWRLQAQTNSLTTGLGTNWFDVANSTNVNQLTLPASGTNASVFYRLTYP